MGTEKKESSSCRPRARFCSISVFFFSYLISDFSPLFVNEPLLGRQSRHGRLNFTKKSLDSVSSTRLDSHDESSVTLHNPFFSVLTLSSKKSNYWEEHKLRFHFVCYSKEDAKNSTVKRRHTRQTGAVANLILPPPTIATSHFKGVLSSGGVVGCVHGDDSEGRLVDCGLLGSPVRVPGSRVVEVPSLEVCLSAGIQRNC